MGEARSSTRRAVAGPPPAGVGSAHRTAAAAGRDLGPLDGRRHRWCGRPARSTSTIVPDLRTARTAARALGDGRGPAHLGRPAKGAEHEADPLHGITPASAKHPDGAGGVPPACADAPLAGVGPPVTEVGSATSLPIVIGGRCVGATDRAALAKGMPAGDGDGWPIGDHDGPGERFQLNPAHLQHVADQDLRSHGAAHRGVEGLRLHLSPDDASAVGIRGGPRRGDDEPERDASARSSAIATSWDESPGPTQLRWDTDRLDAVLTPDQWRRARS